MNLNGKNNVDVSNVATIITKTSSESSEPCFYCLRLLIWHPKLSGVEITGLLQQEPSHVKTRQFDNIPMTVWTLNSITNETRAFSLEIEDVVDWIGDKHEFWSSMRAEHAKAMLILELSGKVNIGDNLSPALLRKISDLGLTFGLEVFPDLTLPNHS